MKGEKLQSDSQEPKIYRSQFVHFGPLILDEISLLFFLHIISEI